MSFKSVHLKERPQAAITSSTFETRTNKPLSEADLKDGELLLRGSVYSLDPAMRGWMSDARSYIPPVKIGEVMRGSAISEVVASKSKDYKAGEYVLATTGWTEFAIIKAKHVERLKLVGKHGIVPGDYQSVLGMTALTAYFGMINCGRIAEKPKGSTVVVSGAAGATGLIAGQIAKIYGMRVIGIAGGKQKCEFLKSVGFDEAVDYKSPTFYKDLCKVTPKFIDFFFDNTGGDILDACFKRAAFKSVFVICGAVSQYLKGKPVGPAYYTNIIAQRQRVEGFIVFDYESEYDSAREKLAEWYSQGKLTKQEHVVKGSVEELPQALQMLFDGKNTGKMVVHVDGASKAKL